jgi:hypothetical protein
MSIEITGPANYDFQDLACLYIILQMWDQPNLSASVEPEFGEDASLRYDVVNEHIHTEMQVKASAVPLEIPVLAEYLAHFPKRQDDNFLLKRLSDSQNSQVFFILSARVSGALTGFLLKPSKSTELRNFGAFTNADAQNIKDGLKDFASTLKNSALDLRRRAVLEKFIADSSLKEIKVCLQRIILLENVDADRLKGHCRNFLRERYSIPDDHFDAVMFRLIEEIKRAKQNNLEARALLVKVFDSLTFASLRPERYVERGNEKTLIQVLQKENILLLSGQPRVGKSNH